VLGHFGTVAIEASAAMIIARIQNHARSGMLTSMPTHRERPGLPAPATAMRW
jgi:hypothetical protein